jgi:uncharacterized protein
MQKFRTFFDKFILSYPKVILACLFIVICFLGYKAKDFKLDASAETLVLENDEALNYARVVSSIYGEGDYLVITYAPEGNLFSERSLKNLTKLRDELKALNWVESVVSMLDVPLLESPGVPIKEIAGNIQTLESESVDKELAKIEFQKSPLYQSLLISRDMKTTALLINLPPDKVYGDLLNQRNYLREKDRRGELSPKESAELKKVAIKFAQHRDKKRQERHQNIADIRKIMDQYRDNAELFLGGVSMIADDMISFIKNDLKIFGVGVLIFLIFTLRIIFKQKRWIVLPVLCCGFSALCMIGILGLSGWEVTVISSNFISLQLIISMAITIHLIVRYREILQSKPDADQRELVLDTVCLMIKPCLYAGLTTVAGFGSLVLCDILPIITFGWMMIVGVTVSLIVTFLLFPNVLILMNKKENRQVKSDFGFSFTSILARLTETRGNMIMTISCLLFAVSLIGIARLDVENCFIDYFKESTEIYQGMKVIDQNLGGTTPFDVILEFDEEKNGYAEPISDTKTEEDEEFGGFDEFEEFDDTDKSDKYWFTSDKMALIMKVHNYLENLPEIGKVLSLGTMLKIAEKLNYGKPLDNFKLALIYSEIPEEFKNIVITPYVSVEHNQVRFSIRIIDSEKSLKRNELLKKIRYDLTHRLGLKKERVHLSGMLVLYNNMLQSLFSSQILTIGTVVLVLMCMFLILFRSVKIALIAIFPNLLSIATVLGFMGLLNIPLDMMTITIAAISIGIAVDDTIHYIHRFIQEFKKDRSYISTLYRCHKSIGNAMYYTSLTIIIGFSILCMSNFIPSIYFGLLTSLAMSIALIAALTLLPQLIVFFKPLGSEEKRNNEQRI